MKRCPECRRDYYDDSLLYCLDDGVALLEGPALGDEPVTAVMPPDTSAPGQPGKKDTSVYASPDLISKEFSNHKIRSALIIAAVILVISGFGYGVYRFFEKPATHSVANSGNIEIRRLTGDGKTDGAGISPDGKILVYTRTEGESSTLWIKQIVTDSSIQVQTSADLTYYSNLNFSPDGSFVYFNGFGRTRGWPTLYRVPVFGGTPTKVLENAFNISFSPDGRRIAYGRADQSKAENYIFVANLDGTNERKLATRSGRKFFNAWPSWSPDGKYVAVSAGDDDLLPKPDEGVILISTDDGSEAELGKAKWASVTSVRWHPSGDSVIVAASDYDTMPGQLWEIAYPSGDVRRLTNNLNGYRNISITADGNNIITLEGYSRSAVWVSPDLDPAKAKPIMPSTGDTWGITWTPDGRIVYVSDQSGDAEVWIMNADGTGAKQLTRDRVFKGFPDVSADGRFIVYSSAENSGRLKRVNINGGEVSGLSSTGFGQDNADISPDDKWVIYSAWVEGAQRILRTPLEGGEGRVLTRVETTEPRYSPDGSQFACFQMDEKTQSWSVLAIYPADGGEPVKQFELPQGVTPHRGPLWMPDARGINFLVQKGEHIDLWVQPVEGGTPKQMSDLGMPYIARRAYSRDGNRIALVRAENIRNAVMITGFR